MYYDCSRPVSLEDPDWIQHSTCIRHTESSDQVHIGAVHVADDNQDGPLSVLMGAARVADLPVSCVNSEGCITEQLLAHLEIPLPPRVLLRTGELGRISRNFVLSDTVAQRLAAEGVTLLGIDQSWAEGSERVLVGHNLVLMDGLVLADVPVGDYVLTALPLKLDSGNVQPVRAVLREVI